MDMSVKQMRLDKAFAKRNCSTNNNLNMWTRTCNQEYKRDYTLKIPVPGARPQTESRPRKKKVTK